MKQCEDCAFFEECQTDGYPCPNYTTYEKVTPTPEKSQKAEKTFK